MSNRQSNIIFYFVIFLFICAMYVNHSHPDVFNVFTKSTEEVLVKEAIENGEYEKAIAHYQKLVAENIDDDNEISIQTADIYEEIAQAYFLLGNQQREQTYYVKSLGIKKQLPKINIHTLANTYSKLGNLAEENKQYDQAQRYYEQALSTRLGDITEVSEDVKKGMFLELQQTRLIYLRSNHRDTIVTYKDLGNIHRIKQEHSISREYYQRALAASINTFGEEDSKTIEIKGLITP